MVKASKERCEKLSCSVGRVLQKGGHHLNINVFDWDTLMDAMEHPENYPQLTIKSGYAVNFNKLTREQQLTLSNRTIRHVI